jgi:hypothetical protein
MIDDQWQMAMSRHLSGDCTRSGAAQCSLPSESAELSHMPCAQGKSVQGNPHLARLVYALSRDS